MRRFAWVAALAVSMALAPVLPAPARADVAAPTLAPADGAVLRTTEAVLTATYDAAAGSSSRIVVRDTADNSRVPCLDEVLFAASMHALRCHLRGLVPGHGYLAGALLNDAAGPRLRTDSWTFSVDAPTLTASWPADGGSVAGTTDDPAPGPQLPLTATYDRDLEATATSARLFASAAGVRTAVPATTTVTGGTVSVAPDQVLAAGQYSLVLRATDGSGGTATRTVDVLVGGPAVLPPAPVDVAASRLLPVPESVSTASPTGTAAGLVVYDPAQPDVTRRLDPVPTALCQYYVSGTTCASALLPVGDLPPGSYSWYAYVRTTIGLTRSGPDHEVTVAPLTQQAPTDLVATAPTSPTDPPLVHVTATADAAAVVVRAVSGASQALAVEPTAGSLAADLAARGMYDGVVQVSARAVDALGRGPAATTTTAPKESVPLRLYGTDPRTATGPLQSIDLSFSELVRADSTVVVHDAQGAPVAGTVTRPWPAQLSWAPAQRLSTQTYAVQVHAYAASCTSPDLTTCEQLTASFQQPVDATPPLAASSVVVDPRLPLPTTPSVTVSGRGTPGDSVSVDLAGSQVLSAPLGAPDSAGSTPFTTGPVDLSPYPRGLLPVTVTTFDGVGNSTVEKAGYVDRRWPVSLGLSSAGPLSIPWGTTTAVAGRLTRYGGTALSGKALTVVQRRDNGTTATVGSARTAADGTFRTVLVLTASGPLQVRWAGASDLRPADAPWTSRVAVGAKGSTPADHPDTPNGARTEPASPQGSWLTETLRSGTDVDWYAFGVATAGYHVVRLGHLPADYAVTLYDRGGNRVGTSNRPGRQFEELYRFLPAGTYYVRVSVVQGYSATVPYHLTFARVDDRVVIVSRHVDVPGQQVLVELLNNTGQWRGTGLVVQCVGSGRVVREEHWVGPLLAPRARTPYAAYPLPCPSGSALRVEPYSVLTASRPPAGSWRLTPHAPVVTTRYRGYPMTVTNTGSTVLRQLDLAVLEYDAEGRVQAFAYDYTDPLAPGASRYVGTVLVYRDTPAPNRYVLLGLYL